MGLKLKGQEVFIELLVDGKPDSKIGPFKKFTATLLQDILEEEFLGASTKEYDEIFNGCQIESEGQLYTERWITFATSVVKRARFQPGAVVTVDVQATLVFSNGKTIPWRFVDVKFGEWPIDVPSRRDYVNIKLTGKCSNQPDV